MPHVIKRCLQTLLVVVSFVLTTLQASPAYAEATAFVSVECANLTGSATYSVTVNGDIAGHAVVLLYDNGYEQYGNPDQGLLFSDYGAAHPSDSADVGRVYVIDGHTSSSIADVPFDRDPQCGERPNRPPVADPVSGSVGRYSEVTLPLLGSDPDGGDVLTYSLATQPGHGTATLAGSDVTYVPDGTFVGTDTFTYAVADGNGGTATGQVSIQVDDASQVTPVPPTFQRVSMTTYKASVTLPASDSVQYRVYRIVSDGVDEFTYDEGVRTGVFEFQAGDDVRVVAEPASQGTSLVGTTEWNYRTYLPLNLFGAANGLENSFMVENQNAVAVKLSWQGASTWVPANTTRTVKSSVGTMVWTAATAEGEYVANGTLVTRQVRPAGRITFNCRGSREVTRFHLNNRASNVAVKFDFSIGPFNRPVWRWYERVAAKRIEVVRHRGGLKPGRMVYLYAWTDHNRDHTLLAKRRVPRGC